MALFSLRPSFISSFPFSRPYSIPKISVAETLTPKTIIHRSLGISIPAQVNHSSALQSFLCCTNSASSVEGESSHSARIIIKGLSPSTSEKFLTKIFSRFGEVSRVKIITDRKSKQSLGFAYVWFTNEESVHLAAEEMDGKFLGGRFVAVMIAKPESPSSHWLSGEMEVEKPCNEGMLLYKLLEMLGKPELGCDNLYPVTPTAATCFATPGSAAVDSTTFAAGGSGTRRYAAAGGGSGGKLVDDLLLLVIYIKD
ncbi:hypothetical protein NE237_015016 [Protea cynaroides]|uniref:RRM domain-containing protein n=1 Tax=Protea cynaroides TaxID=273540 RepID=A0A9Q0KD77_9MAGN|nr:hypothetical protein NE237_015016 [Protea cynaroides]